MDDRGSYVDNNCHEQDVIRVLSIKAPPRDGRARKVS